MLAQCDQGCSMCLPPSDPGGIWINLGPLLWTLSRVLVGPSLEGTVQASLLVGFGLLPVDEGVETMRIVVCKHASDSEAITQRLCGAAFWVSQKIFSPELMCTVRCSRSSLAVREFRSLQPSAYFSCPFTPHGDHEPMAFFVSPFFISNPVR